VSVDKLNGRLVIVVASAKKSLDAARAVCTLLNVNIRTMAIVPILDRNFEVNIFTPHVLFRAARTVVRLDARRGLPDHFYGLQGFLLVRGTQSGLRSPSLEGQFFLFVPVTATG
jgi:hypothetical protein